MSNMTQWKNIDPNFAEKKFKYLTDKIRESDGVISEIQLKAGNDIDFATKISLQSIIEHNKELKREYNDLIKHRKFEVISIMLDADIFKDSSADLVTLSDLLKVSQRLFTSIAQSLTSGPTERGRVGDALENLTRLRLVETFPSSFGLKIKTETNPDIFGESVTLSSLNTLYSVLNSLENKEVLIEKVGNMSSRTISHLRSMISLLTKNEISTKIEWRTPTGLNKTWHRNKNEINQIGVNIESIKVEKSEDIRIEGQLLGASLLRNTFEIITEKEVYSGRMTKDAREIISDVFGKKVIASLLVNKIHDKLTNEVKEKYTLKMAIEE